MKERNQKEWSFCLAHFFPHMNRWNFILYAGMLPISYYSLPLRMQHTISHTIHVCNCVIHRIVLHVKYFKCIFLPELKNMCEVWVQRTENMFWCKGNFKWKKWNEPRKIGKFQNTYIGGHWKITIGSVVKFP